MSNFKKNTYNVGFLKTDVIYLIYNYAQNNNIIGVKNNIKSGFRGN